MNISNTLVWYSQIFWFMCPRSIAAVVPFQWQTEYKLKIYIVFSFRSWFVKRDISWRRTKKIKKQKKLMRWCHLRDGFVIFTFFFFFPPWINIFGLGGFQQVWGSKVNARWAALLTPLQVASLLILFTLTNYTGSDTVNRHNKGCLFFSVLSQTKSRLLNVCCSYKVFLCRLRLRSASFGP